jgi:CDP-diacylglycerol--glycerol-3-phosphate 3-phosphatidyltransferase
MRWSSTLSYLPVLLTSLRLALAPALIGLGVLWPAPAAMGAVLVAAFLSDVFDGIIARRLGIATPGLRRLDSTADTVFYVAVAIVAWRLYPGAIAARAVPLAVLGTLEVVRYAFDWFKFRREASYHMWSAKLFGLALFVGCFSLLACGSDNATVTAAVYCGIFSDLEGLLISARLKRWRADVPSLLHAIQADR